MPMIWRRGWRGGATRVGVPSERMFVGCGTVEEHPDRWSHTQWHMSRFQTGQ